MNWATLPDQWAIVMTAFAAAEQVIGTALARAVGKHVFTVDDDLWRTRPGSRRRSGHWPPRWPPRSTSST